MILKEFLEKIKNSDICGVWVYIVNEGEYCLDDDYLDEFKGYIEQLSLWDFEDDNILFCL